jgi:SNF2 family DNA or RNA helicase
MKTKPLKHQQECFNLSWEKKNFALFLEQGLGKTKIVLDTAEKLFKARRIEALLVIAPNGVHSNWIRQEIPKHLDCPYYAVEYSAGRPKTKKFQDQINRLFYPTVGRRELRILAANVEAYSTPCEIAEISKKLLEKFPSLMAVDESDRIKTPKAARTKRVLNIGKRAKYKRILTGTPITQSPFDLYAEMGFLDYSILGFYSFYAFKHEYGRWAKNMSRSPDGRTWEYEKLIKYVRLDDLADRILPCSYRRLKSECMDLPEKIYKVHGIYLNPTQRKLYDRVLKDGVIEFDDFRMLNPLQITRLLRCQQIVGGFLPAEHPLDDPESARLISEKNPKLDLLFSLMEDHPGKTVVWARFRAEIRAIVKRLKEAYDPKSVVELHGGVNLKNRRESQLRFQSDPSCRFIVGQQASGVGIDLFEAEVVYYYSNSFSYKDRYQTEDRAHRIGLKHPVIYIDLVAYDTVDERIREVLRKSSVTAYKVLDERR